jgi:hypothetical protein
MSSDKFDDHKNVTESLIRTTRVGAHPGRYDSMQRSRTSILRYDTFWTGFYFEKLSLTCSWRFRRGSALNLGKRWRLWTPGSAGMRWLRRLPTATMIGLMWPVCKTTNEYVVRPRTILLVAVLVVVMVLVMVEKGFVTNTDQSSYLHFDGDWRRTVTRSRVTVIPVECTAMCSEDGLRRGPIYMRTCA